MFNLHGTDRLTAWRDFRNKLETSNTPLEDVAEFWSQAPFVGPYLNPNEPESWPDPWHLVLDSHWDDLAIVLGMLYTIKLTDRFKDTQLDIRSFTAKDGRPQYLLVVNNKHVLNLEYRCVITVEEVPPVETNLVYTAFNK